ncbi:MAG: pyridoxal phosphate-dependent aminotransferase [Candidatus Aminicenantales bacterium]
MRVEPVRYMEWAKLHAPAKINLSRSGLADLSLADVAIDQQSLEINGEQPYGYPPLIEAVAARYGVKEENVLPVNGASQGIFFAGAVLLEPGDEVLVEQPAYEPLLAVPRFFRAEIKRFVRRFEDGYALDCERLRTTLTDRTKLVILTNLHNPSGVSVDDRALIELTAAASERGAMVFVDEIYLEFLEDKKPATSFRLAENVIVTSSLTKVFGLGGLRCGWMLAPEALVGRMKRLMDLVSVEGVYIGEQISARVFSRLDSLRALSRPLIERNVALVKAFIGEEKKLSWVEPAGGIIGFPRIEAGLDGTQLARILREEYDTSIVPGHFFEAARHFRLGFGIPTEALKHGLENIRKALASF